MKAPINLASQPFRRDRALIAASLAVSAFLMATLVLFVYLAMLDRAQLAGVRHDIARLHRQVAALATEQGRFDGVLRKPENASVLERSVFLNYLIYHKAISWSHIFGDLEKTVPYNVKIISLRPSINAQNQVVLDMNAGAESAQALIDFLKSLESSSVFSQVYSKTIQQPTQAEPLYRCHVTVDYAQKL
jgi:type IV pilus assembly protein PilN